MTLTVVSVGPQALVEDSRGRPGLAASGVSVSGAFDRRSLERANRIVGNDTGSAGVEALLGGLVLRAEHDHLVCVTGALGPLAVDDRPIHHEWPTLVRAGQSVTIGRPDVGLRSYLAVQGGLDVAGQLGSASTDTLSGLGAASLRPGMPLGVMAAHGDAVAGGPDPWLGPADLSVDVIPGPRDDWFTPEALRTLLTTRWIVSTRSSRVAIGLEGPRLPRRRSGELPSEPCIRGSIQVAAHGQPVVFGPDHPVTGGYPVIGVVIDAHTDSLGQARPGQGLHFRRHSPRPGR